MIQEKNIVNILILLAVSDDELHQKEREFIQDFIDEKNFNLDIDQILEEMKSKFRDDFETSCLFYLNSIEEKFIRDEIIDLTRKLAAADLIVRDREIKFLELVKKEWKI